MATGSSSISGSSGGGKTPAKDAPLPSDSEIWSFGCKCLNVTIDGRRMNDDRSFGSGKARVWIGVGAEHIKQPAYVSYDQDPIVQRGSGSSRLPAGDTLGPSWRMCWICETKLYRVAGKARADPGAVNDWVEVDPSAVLHGKALEEASEVPSLPFSGLNIPLPSSSSTFGRPPVDPAPSIYSPVSLSPSQTPRPRQASLIPPVHDPFFLPPPFIPAHPHLRDLCNSAVNHLLERHTSLENEVKQFISDKAREMSDLEEKVRAEVELLWEKYKVGPGAGEDFERKRSLSMSRPEIASSPPPMSVSPTNPILREAALQSPGQGSLLSASISANQMFAPPPPPVADAVDDSISEAAKTYSKTSDQRAMAMSYVFSALDETMANQARSSVRKTRRRSAAQEDREEAQSGPVQDVHGKDSWIEQERITAASVLRDRAKEEEEVMDGTPRAALPKVLEERRGSKGKEKARVTFEEPIPEESKPTTPAVTEREGGDEDDDYVFDFELDNSSSTPRNTDSPDVQTQAADISRTRNIVEANLSSTFAADAPSHRAAWRKMGDKSPLYASIKRRDPTESEDGEEDVEQISKLATSVPISIALPTRRVVSGFQYEPKTSLSERTGILVPPLKAAMREQGVGRQGRPSIAADSPGRRSASVSRERDSARSFRADPGAVFESLADDGDSDEDDEDVEEQGGTLRESRTFMPPHILARKESRETGDVGWRSMVEE